MFHSYEKKIRKLKSKAKELLGFPSLNGCCLFGGIVASGMGRSLEESLGSIG